MNAKAATWHYLRTAAGIAVFWVCFYLFAVYFSLGSKPTTFVPGALLAQDVSVLFALLSKMLFVVNLTSAIVWLRRPASATTTLSVCFAAHRLRRSVQGFRRARGSLSRRP